MALDFSRLSRVPLAYWCAVFFGLVAAILTLAAPRWLLGHWVQSVGIGHVIPALAPPLGMKARAVVALLQGGIVAALCAIPYFILGQVKNKRAKHRFYAESAGKRADSKASERETPVVDVMPTRRPIFADQELGAPLMSDAALEHVARHEESVPPTAVVVDDVHERGSVVENPEPDVPPVFTLPHTPVDVANEASAPHDLHAELESLSLEQMIARLENGLAARNPTPPEPPVAHQPIGLPKLVDSPLSVVPKAAKRQALDDNEGESALQEAMGKLSKLVGGMR